MYPTLLPMASSPPAERRIASVNLQCVREDALLLTIRTGALCADGGRRRVTAQDQDVVFVPRATSRVTTRTVKGNLGLGQATSTSLKVALVRESRLV